MRVLVLVVVIALDEVVRFRERSGLGVVIMIGRCYYCYCSL